MRTILFVDDEKSNRILFETQFEDIFTVLTAEDGEAALKLLSEHEVGIVLSDERMPGMSGIDLLAQVAQHHPVVGRIIISAYGDAERVLRAINTGKAHEYLLKPWRRKELKQCLEAAFFSYERRLVLENSLEQARALQEDVTRELPENGLIGEKGGLKEAVMIARKAAKSDATILLRGETGSGKEVMARLIHESSPRVDGPFMQVNCAALSEGLLESELFGHEKGAFTGAISQKKGRFELADKGTIFLDEIGDIPAKMQADLLRVLQERTLERVGGTRSIHVDVRVIAATHRNLEEQVAVGRFREDLFYRLNVIPLMLPPLRERKEDVPDLVRFFIKKHWKEPSPAPTIGDDVLATLRSYDWPGNIRELENLVQRALVLSDGQILTMDDFTIQITSFTREDAKQQLADDQTKDIQEALTRCGGNLSRAARDLGLPRSTLVNRAKKLGLL